MRAPLLSSLLFATICITATQSARAGDAAAAQVLFEEGRTLMEAGHYDQACPKLEDSYKLDPASGTEYNLALCYELSGRTATAWATYLSAAAKYKASGRPEWEAKARDKARALADVLSSVTVTLPNGSAPGAHVFRDGRELAASEVGVAIPLDPGRHLFTAKSANGAEWRESFDLAQREKKRLVVTFGAAPPSATAPPASSTAPTSPPPESEDPGASQRTWGLVAGGVGAAGLAFGGVAGLIAIGHNNTSKRDCPNDGVCTSSEALAANDSARNWATMSTIGFAAGGALVALGLTLFFTAPARHDTTRAAILWGPTGVRGTW